MSILSRIRKPQPSLDDRQERCPECETLNDTFVNPHGCWSCGHEWGDA